MIYRYKTDRDRVVVSKALRAYGIMKRAVRKADVNLTEEEKYYIDNFKEITKPFTYRILNQKNTIIKKPDFIKKIREKTGCTHVEAHWAYNVVIGSLRELVGMNLMDSPKWVVENAFSIKFDVSTLCSLPMVQKMVQESLRKKKSGIIDENDVNEFLGFYVRPKIKLSGNFRKVANKVLRFRIKDAKERYEKYLRLQQQKELAEKEMKKMVEENKKAKENYSEDTEEWF